MKEIPLTQGKVALIDDEDFERVSSRRWHYHKRFNSEYAMTNICVDGRRTTVELHRFILSPPKGAIVDHRDLNGLNCQRHNMRVATRSQNERNRLVRNDNFAGIKGVHKRRTSFCVQISTDFGRMRLGALSRSEAVAVYDAMAREFHAEFANTNR